MQYFDCGNGTIEIEYNGIKIVLFQDTIKLTRADGWRRYTGRAICLSDSDDQKMSSIGLPTGEAILLDCDDDAKPYNIYQINLKRRKYHNAYLYDIIGREST